MRVVGVLAPAYTADDDAVFVDLKTAWVIEGLGHGHQDLAPPEAASGVLTREGDTIIANASVVQYNEITPENIDSFHFHGDLADFPITAVIAVPPRHEIRHDPHGALRGSRRDPPDRAPVDRHGRAARHDPHGPELRRGGHPAGGLATLATAALVFLLSLRLRRREIETMVKIGGSRGRIGAVLVSEVVVVLVAGVLLAGVLTVLTRRFGEAAIRALLLG